MPARVAVPFPLSVKITPSGRFPVSLSVGKGEPLVVIRNQPVIPSVKVVMLPEVMARFWVTTNVKLWVAFVPTPFAAVMVI